MSPNADAATTMRQHAELASVFALRIGKLADATEKLQAVLNEDQRKVLDRIVRLHSQFHGRHHGERWEDHETRHHKSDMSPGAARPSPKAAAQAKPKN